MNIARRKHRTSIMSMGKVVAVLGCGLEGKVLSDGFLKHGYTVVRGARDPAKLTGWLDKANPRGEASIGTFEQACIIGEIIVLCVPGASAEKTLHECGMKHLECKIIIDTTNPVAEPLKVEHGVEEYFTGPNDSLMERLQREVPEGRFVKAFNSVGHHLFVNPDFGEEKPTMFICGNDCDAKEEVSEILDKFGWSVSDMGHARSARAIEPLYMLWCIKAFTTGSNTHFFRFVE
jgi:predicted dinucleotide-binding enzyme